MKVIMTHKQIVSLENVREVYRTTTGIKPYKPIIIIKYTDNQQVSMECSSQQTQDALMQEIFQTLAKSTRGV